MKTLIVAAAVVAATISTGFASEIKGKVGDLPGVSERLATAKQSATGANKAKLAKAEKIIKDCDIHVTTQKIEGAGKLRCNDIGLKVNAEIRRTSSGVNLAKGECTAPLKFSNLDSIFGWKNSTSICRLSDNKTYRMTGSAKIPADFKI